MLVFFGTIENNGDAIKQISKCDDVISTPKNLATEKLNKKMMVFARIAVYQMKAMHDIESFQ